jgi:hypothetical protein
MLVGAKVFAGLEAHPLSVIAASAATSPRARTRLGERRMEQPYRELQEPTWVGLLARHYEAERDAVEKPSWATALPTTGRSSRSSA